MAKRVNGPELARIEVRIPNSLYNLVVEQAEAMQVTLGEVLVKAFAEQTGRGEEWRIEKGRPGRRPKLRRAEALA